MLSVTLAFGPPIRKKVPLPVIPSVAKHLLFLVENEQKPIPLPLAGSGWHLGCLFHQTAIYLCAEHFVADQ